MVGFNFLRAAGGYNSIMGGVGIYTGKSFTREEKCLRIEKAHRRRPVACLSLKELVGNDG